MAVAPSVTVYNPKNFVQKRKRLNTTWVFIRKNAWVLGAINVTPGPLTILEKSIRRLRAICAWSQYRRYEIAYRMQKNEYKIEHCNDAFVYTNTPTTIKKLYKQRLRWIYGFINNTIDYRSVLFKKRYRILLSLLYQPALFLFWR